MRNAAQEAVFETCRTRVNETLHEILETFPIADSRLRQAMAHALFPGGKRIRPLLVYLTGALFDTPPGTLDTIAAAIELVHTYSLVHDDLPAMDNDDLRRGLPTCHRAFDEATAILAGDALQSLGIEVLTTRLVDCLPAEATLNIVGILLHASGAAGMVSGQSLDLTVLQQPDVPEIELRRIHSLKTGRLIEACVRMVLTAGEVDSKAAQPLLHFATDTGIAFQIQDDYLDRYSACETLGKGQASDAVNAKTTFASLYERDALIALLEAQFAKALQHLTPFGARADGLRALVQVLMARTHHTESASCNSSNT